MKKTVYAICAALLCATPAPVLAVPHNGQGQQRVSIDARLLALANKYPHGGEAFRKELTKLLQAHPSLASQAQALAALNPDLSTGVNYALAHYQDSTEPVLGSNVVGNSMPFIPGGSNFSGGSGGGGTICSISPVTVC